MAHHRTRRPALIVVALAALAAGGRAQEPASAERFAGWDGLRDPAFRFDPDDRPVLGFAVRDTTAARAAVLDAEQALRDGDARTAARVYARMVAELGDQAVQVAADPERWVGAGEWALYQLATRVPDAARAGLASPEELATLDRALAWRDAEALRRLAWRLEGLPEGGRAATLAARLFAERGLDGPARAAAARALQLGADDVTGRLAVRLASPAEAPPPPAGSLPEELTPLWSADFVVAHLYRDKNPFDQQPEGDEAPMAPIRPIVRDGVVYVADSLSVTARDVLSGRTLWHHAGPMESTQDDPASGYFGFGVYVGGWRERAVSPYQDAQPVVAGDLVLATVQVPEPAGYLPTFDNIPINWPLPRRRLVALDRETGERVWRQERPEAGEADFRNTFDVAGPPAVADGVVYAAGSVSLGSINSYVAAFDLATGDLLWRTLLCAGQQDLTMFNRPFQEHTASPPLVEGGSVYVSTNLGVVAALDAWSGRLRWLTSYATMARRASRSPERDQRRSIRWINEPPLLDDGRLVVTPLDSTDLLVLDAATGRTQSTKPSRMPGSGYRFRHQVLGLGDGLVAVVGDSVVECVSLASGAVKWERPLGLLPDDRVTGPAVVSDGRLLVPSFAGLTVLALDGATLPVLRPWEGAPMPRGVRAVVPAGAVLLYHDNWSLHAAVDVEGALQALHARSPGAPEALLGMAELLLTTGRYEEAEDLYDALVASGDEALAVRARSGRLETALRRARVENEVTRWNELLESAQKLGDPWKVASEALVSLDALGAEGSVERWLGALAARDGDRRLALGALTPEGSAPVGLVAARFALADDPPARAVARLQEMLVRWPEESWDGVPVRERAAARLHALLDAHGRELYERYEREAREALLVADDASTVAEVSARYPNAEVVAEARRTRHEDMLQSGHAREVLEELARRPPPGPDEQLLDLRVRAARALGEDVLAEALAGRAPPPVDAGLPRVPGAGAAARDREVTVNARLAFPQGVGRADAPWQGCALAELYGRNELALVDAASASARWRRDVPGQHSRRSMPTVAYVMAGDRVVAHVEGGSRAPERSPLDLLEAISLADGSTLWARSPSGSHRGTIVADGMVLRLHKGETGGSALHRLEGYGTASGVLALSVDLPACADARLLRVGRHVVVFSASDSRRSDRFTDARLAVLDVPTGTLRSGAVLPVDFADVVAVLDEPPRVLLSSRAGAVGTGAWLAAWDPERLELAWESEVSAGDVRREVLYPTVGGRLLLLTGSRSSPDRRGTAQVVPVDGRTGPLPPVDTGARLYVLDGQSRGPVPRLVLLDVDDPGRLLVVDGRTGAPRYEVRVPPVPPDDLRVVHGRDGFVLVADPLTQDDPVTVRVFDGETGKERYSVFLDRFSLPGRADLALTEGALVLADEGRVHVIRSDEGR